MFVLQRFVYISRITTGQNENSNTLMKVVIATCYSQNILVTIHTEIPLSFTAHDF